MLRTFFSTLLFIWVAMYNTAAQAQATELVASLDRNPINADESVTLILTANGNIDDEQPDFSALNNDFRFSTPSVSRSTQIINGVRSSSVTWRINLIPKSAGTFTIPKFTLGGVESNSLGVRVMPAGTASGEPREFFLSTELNQSEIYLQQQLVYTVKIFIAGEIQSGSLSEPDLPGAIIEKLGDDNEYQELIDGVRYRVIERNFAVIPQSSGDFVINSPVFEARVISRLGQNFAYFNRTKTITRIGPEQQVTVKPIPANYQFRWLPSENVILEEEWQGDSQSLTVGEPATRTIKLTALGLTEEQLPEIEAQYHPSFKTYPEQPQRATVQRENRLISQSVLNTAIIAEKAGQFVLPEITVPWFNVNTGKTEFASIPARSITVAQGNAPQTSAPPTVFDSQVEQPTPDVDSEDAPIVRESEETMLFDWLHLVLLSLVLILGGALAAVTINKRVPREKAPAPTGEDEEDKAWNILINKIEKHQVNELPQALSEWVGLALGKQNLNAQQALTFINDEQITAAYHKLISSRYSSSSETADVEALRRQLSNFRAKCKAPPTSAIPSFYPNTVN